VDGKPVTPARAAVPHARSPTSRYRDIDLSSRVETATPHELVAMLYGEMAAALDVLMRANEAGDAGRRLAQHERASSILHRLEAGLDLSNGGTLAASLAGIYRQMRRRLLAARDGDMAAAVEVKAGIDSLANAWSRISL
jgi:flagellar secretion chaperone FliS